MQGRQQQDIKDLFRAIGQVSFYVDIRIKEAADMVRQQWDILDQEQAGQGLDQDPDQGWIAVYRHRQLQ